MKRIAWIILIVVLVLVLGAVQLVTLISQPSTAALSITSPSGKASIVKEYDGQEGQVVGAIKIFLKTSNSWYSFSTPILQLQSSGIMGDDGIIFGWENDRHLTIGWPSDSPPIHGPDHVGDIAISYRSYDPDIDRISGHNYQALQLHNIAVNFKETNQYHGWYAATHEPVPYIKCIIEISGKDGKAFEDVTAQIIGNGIGRSGDKNTSFGMVSVKYIFSRPVGKPATLTPTQATLNHVFPKYLKSLPQQTNQSIFYHDYNPSEVLNLISSLKRGKLNLKVGLNFGQETLVYNGDVNLTNDVIDKFNACSAKTNIYSDPFRVPSHN